MTNTYIQDKLDEFDEIVELTIELIEGGAVLNKNDLKMALKEKTKKLFTDYHNHIVEKVKERFESGEYEMEDGFSYENGIDLSEIPNELFIEFKGIKKGMLGITNYIKKDLIKLLNNI